MISSIKTGIISYTLCVNWHFVYYTYLQFFNITEQLEAVHIYLIVKPVPMQYFTHSLCVRSKNISHNCREHTYKHTSHYFH